MENQPRLGNTNSQSDDDVAEQLFRQQLCALRPLLRGRAQILVGTEHDAEDAVQETYRRALQSVRRPPLEEVSRWLLVILKHTIIDGWRAAKHITFNGLAVEEVAAPGPEEDEPWACFSDQEVRAAIAELPEVFREVVRRRELEEASYQQIAEDLSIPISTAGTRLLRGRDHLKARLEGLLRDRGEVCCPR